MSEITPTPPPATPPDSSTGASLSHGELEQLSRFQGSAGPAAMSLEAIDGFFCALVCGPEIVSPSEYLPEVWGSEFAFGDSDQLQAIVDLLLRHWNHIAHTLGESKSSTSLSYTPWLRPNGEGFVSGSDWAAGFMRGVRLRRGTWRELMLDPKVAGWLTPVLALTHENAPDPSLRSPLLAPDKRPQLLALMAGSLPKIYAYFSRARKINAAKAASPDSVRHDAPRPGRNDLCACGSGKKYKHCCLH